MPDVASVEHHNVVARGARIHVAAAGSGPPLVLQHGPAASCAPCGELLVCPICVTSRGLDGTEFVADARIAGATPLWEWIGDEAATVFSY